MAPRALTAWYKWPQRGTAPPGVADVRPLSLDRGDGHSSCPAAKGSGREVVRLTHAVERLDIPKELLLVYSPGVGEELRPCHEDLLRVVTQVHHPLPAVNGLVQEPCRRAASRSCQEYCSPEFRMTRAMCTTSRAICDQGGMRNKATKTNEGTNKKKGGGSPMVNSGFVKPEHGNPIRVRKSTRYGSAAHYNAVPTDAGSAAP